MSTPTHKQNESMHERARILVGQMNEIRRRREEEKRDYTAEEREQLDKMFADAQRYKEDAERENRASQLEKAIDVFDNAASREAPEPEVRSEYLYTVTSSAPPRIDLGADDYTVAFRSFMRGHVTPELRALEQGVASEGGALVPTPLLNIVEGIANQAMSIYPLASRYQTDSGRLDVPYVATSGTASAGANEETDMSSGSSDPAFGLRNLDCNNRKAYHFVRVSDELMSDSVVDLMRWLGEHLGNAIAEQDEQAYVSGNGTNKPTGFLGAATVGVNTTAAFTYANLQALVASVRQGWRRNGSWVMSESTFAQALSLEDSGNTLIFQPATTVGGNDVFLGYRLRTSFAMPGDSAGNRPIAFGDFGRYYIVEKPLRVASSEHRYFDTGQVAIRAEHRRDGVLSQPDAIKVISRNS